MFYIECTMDPSDIGNQYAVNIEGVFEDRKVADQVCAFLTKANALGGIANQWFYGEFEVKEMPMSKSFVDWRTNGASFDFEEMLEEIQAHRGGGTVDIDSLLESIN